VFHTVETKTGNAKLSKGQTKAANGTNVTLVGEKVPIGLRNTTINSTTTQFWRKHGFKISGTWPL
jgi:hypothetical protein